jgi:uncharacterized protein YndB with AHSA1/START domain
MSNKTSITKDLADKKIRVVRTFDAPLEKVWKAWTERELLDKWWAPKPWRAETKTFDFRPEGVWLYAMVGPDGTKVWSWVDFITITTGRQFSTRGVFCDEQGNRDQNTPALNWLVQFDATGTGTTVVAEISFDDEADMKKIIEMGFEGGFTMGLGNLEELLGQG